MSAADDKDADQEKPAAASSSGSIDVATDSSPAIPAASAASSSGSIDVALSGPSPKVSDGAPEITIDLDSAPVSSGKVRVAVAGEGEATRPSQRLVNAARDTIGAGVERLGSGIGTIGEGVQKLGEKSRGVPLVGGAVTKLGDSLSQVGESIHELPRAAKTRRGRLLVRSLIVGFVLVAAWIVVIVALQVKGSKAPDFRPIAEKILIELSDGTEGIERVYEAASPRFQEMVRKERFADEMSDLAATVGAFKEIAAVNESLVTQGPTGRVGRVSLTVSYEKAKCKASVSLHQDKGVWRLLGVGVDLPPELAITQAQREERVQACKDTMAKSCDLFVVASGIFEQLRDGKYAEVWDGATSVFQQQEEKPRFVALQTEHAGILGNYIRILAVTEARVISGTHATYDVIAEYTRAQGVRTIFSFYRGSKARPWKLRSLNTVLPMPRAGEQADDEAVGSNAVPSPAVSPAPASLGSGSATTKP